MKILVLSQYWYPENGVPQRRWSWLTDILQRTGHQIVVVAPPPHYRRPVSLKEWVSERGFANSQKVETGRAGETIQRTGYFPSGRSLTRRIFNQGWTAACMVGTLVRRTGYLRTFNPDLIIGTVPALPTAAVTYLASRVFDAPYVMDLRDAWPALFRESQRWNAGTGPASLREKLLRRGPFQILLFATERMLEAALGRASGIITTSSVLEKYVASQYSVPTATVRNVFPGPFLARRQSRVTSERTLNVLYAGTLGRAQKLDNALLAAKIAQDRGVKIALKFVGDGAARETLKRRASELGVNLHLDHQLDPESLDSYYEWADTALVHLTEWNSLKAAVPSKAYELMSNRIHISGVVSGETATLISTLNAGDIVEPNDPDALAQLWVDLATDRCRLEVGESGRRWVKQQRDIEAPAAILGLLQQIKGAQ